MGTSRGNRLTLIDLERDDVLAALVFGAPTAGGGRVPPIGAARSSWWTPNCLFGSHDR